MITPVQLGVAVQLLERTQHYPRHIRHGSRVPPPLLGQYDGLTAAQLTDKALQQAAFGRIQNPAETQQQMTGAALLQQAVQRSLLCPVQTNWLQRILLGVGLPLAAVKHTRIGEHAQQQITLPAFRNQLPGECRMLIQRFGSGCQHLKLLVVERQINNRIRLQSIQPPGDSRRLPIGGLLVQRKKLNVFRCRLHRQCAPEE